MKNCSILFVSSFLLLIANACFFSFLNEYFFHLKLKAAYAGISRGDTSIIAIFIAPLAETIVTQALLYFLLKKVCNLKNDILAILIMSLAFSLLHGYNYLYIATAFFAGIILNGFYVYIYKKNDFLIAFWLTVLLHTVYNVFATFA